MKSMFRWSVALVLLTAAPALAAPPGQVTGVKAFHRAGQTFITWKEVQPPIADEKVTYGQYKKALAEAKDACRYAIYAAEKPIDAASLKQAKLVGEVGPLSAYNVNARNKEYLIGQAMIQPDRIGELAENYNGRMHTWTMDSKRMDRYPLRRFVIDEKAGPLPPGTGLYVHHPSKAAKRYYAVVAVRGGAKNTTDFASNVAGPVDETVGPGEPVRQGKGLQGPHFDFAGTRWVYVQWCAPPLAPKPNMVFNWSVMIPPHTGSGKPVLPGMKVFDKVPAELYFHPAGYSYAQPGKKMMVHSIQIAPHDWPASGWYGFHEAWGQGKALRAGRVINHTQKRIMAFLDWAKKSLPIAADQVVCAGADGAAALALSYPDAFAYVWIMGFNRRGGVLDAKAAKKYEAIWGPKSPGITDEHGRGSWAWAELDNLALASKKDLPLFVCLGYSWGRIKGYAKGRGRFYQAMDKARQPLVANWGWSGLRNRGNVGKYTGVWRGKVMTAEMPVLAFSNSSLNSDRESTGNVSGGFRWTGLVDSPDKFAVTIISRGATFDLTPRRLKRFKPKPDEMLHWTSAALPNPRSRSKTKPAPQSGQVQVGPDGTVTIPKLKYPDRSPQMTVTITKSQ